jgi:hypothetical protein
VRRGGDEGSADFRSSYEAICGGDANKRLIVGGTRDGTELAGNPKFGRFGRGEGWRAFCVSEYRGRRLGREGGGMGW